MWAAYASPRASNGARPAAYLRARRRVGAAPDGRTDQAQVQYRSRSCESARPPSRGGQYWARTSDRTEAATDMAVVVKKRRDLRERNARKSSWSARSAGRTSRSEWAVLGSNQ